MSRWNRYENGPKNFDFWNGDSEILFVVTFYETIYNK
jgi:hypothetical protein